MWWCYNLTATTATTWFHHTDMYCGGMPCYRGTWIKHCELQALQVDTGYVRENVPYLEQSALSFQGFLSFKDFRLDLVIFFMWGLKNH